MTETRGTCRGCGAALRRCECWRTEAARQTIEELRGLLRGLVKMWDDDVLTTELDDPTPVTVAFRAARAALNTNEETT